MDALPADLIHFTMTPNVAQKSTIAMSPLEYIEFQQAAAAAMKGERDTVTAELTTLKDNLRNVLQLGNGDDPAIAVVALVTERDNALKQAMEANEQVQTLTDQNLKNAAEITALQQQLDTGTSDALQAIKAQLTALERQLTEKTDQLTAANKTITGQQVTNEQQNTLLKDALARLAKYEPTTIPPSTIPAPPVVVPTDFAPTITKTRLANLAGVTITKDNEPDPKQDEMTKQVLTLTGSMGFNCWRGLLNIEEVKTQSGYPADDPRSLPAFGRKHGMVFMVDSVDSQAKRISENKLTKAQYVDYFAGLKKLGCVGVYMNDVDAKDKAEFIADWVKWTREAMATARLDAPLIGSFMATFNRLEYPGFDFYEIQTFGRATELKTFLARKDIDVYCLDGQRSESVAELKADTTIQLAANINNFMVYSAFDETTDWRNMPAQVAEIKDFVNKWKAQRVKIVALPA